MLTGVPKVDLTDPVFTGLDDQVCYRAVAGRDRRFDGMFVTGVRTTGIYCRPSCPARTPRVQHVTFHRTAAAAQAAGFRACKRCAPDAVPGSPLWDVRADVAGRAMRLLADGVVEREGIPGLARRLGYSPRHLNRVLLAELGAGPLALARARRAQQARVLVETTGWPMSEVAYAAGFASVRQFNDTFRAVYAAPPSDFRRHSPGSDARGPRPGAARLCIRLAVRTPFAARELWHFLAVHVVPGVETAEELGSRRWYARSLRLPHGPGTVRLDLSDDDGDRDAGVRHVSCALSLTDVRDVAAATERCRRLIDADADPVVVDTALLADPVLATSVTRHPGLRVPGSVDGEEVALRIVLGQQVSVTAGNRLADRLVSSAGDPLPPELREGGLHRLFPTPAAVARLDPRSLPMPAARARALLGLAVALDRQSVRLDRSADRAETRTRLLALQGIGPWTADAIALRALGDPDVFLSTDVGVRRVLSRSGIEDCTSRAASWRPWRSYALLHLWTEAIGSTSTLRED